VRIRKSLKILNQKLKKSPKALDFSGFLCYNQSMKTTDEFAVLQDRIAKLETENAELKALVKHYEERFRLQMHRMWGRGSEATENPDQLSLFNEPETVADKKAPEPKFEEVAGHKRKKRIGKRDELYENLPTEQIVHELPEDEQICPDCGEKLHTCGHEVVRREIEIVPAHVKAIEHVQTVYSCRNCQENAADEPVPMVKSDVPKPVISGSGIVSPSLLSYIICAKYVLALPLYRQEQEFERLGIEIPRQNMANWVIYGANKWLKPIFELLKSELIKQGILHADETTVQVVKEDGREAKQTSYMWLYRSSAKSEKPIILFEYQTTRSSSHPLRFLEGFKGFLHVDGYEGYKKLQPQGVTIVECWAHARRKFHDVLKALEKSDRPNHPANVGYEYCNRLFELERQFDDEKLTPEERLERRLAASKPLAEQFFAWAAEQAALPMTLPKSVFGKAVGYAVNQRDWLMNVFSDGRLAISNNLAESSIRPFTIGRNNWLFAYSAKGADASAAAYSLVETAKANGLVPFEYFKFLFEQMPNISPEQYASLLPWLPEAQNLRQELRQP
jgi:transposase